MLSLQGITEMKVFVQRNRFERRMTCTEAEQQATGKRIQIRGQDPDLSTNSFNSLTVSQSPLTVECDLNPVDNYKASTGSGGLSFHNTNNYNKEHSRPSVKQNMSGHPAEIAARAWLALVDDGKYDEAYEARCDLWQSKVTAENSRKELETLRKDRGAGVSRNQTMAQKANSLPGLPDGDYIILMFQTQFAKGSGSETMVISNEGEWKVFTYAIS